MSIEMNEAQTQQVLKFIRACDIFHRWLVDDMDSYLYDDECVEFYHALKDIKKTLGLV